MVFEIHLYLKYRVLLKTRYEVELCISNADEFQIPPDDMVIRVRKMAWSKFKGVHSAPTRNEHVDDYNASSALIV